MKKFRTSADMSKKVVSGNSRTTQERRPRPISSTSNVGKSEETKIVKSPSKPKAKPTLSGNDIVIKFD